MSTRSSDDEEASVGPDDSRTPKSLVRTPRSAPKSERDKRTYRACLHCRQRKSRCDLYSSGQPGKPPCERCIREQHECILGGSRRGGRRTKKPKPEDGTAQSSGDAVAGTTFAQPTQTPTLPTIYQQSSGPSDQRPLDWPIDRESRLQLPLPQEPPVHTSTPVAKLTVDDSVASHDIQNPADALEFLAHVAGRDSDSNQLAPMHGYGRSHRSPFAQQTVGEVPRNLDMQTRTNIINYPPLVKGYLNFEMLQTLLARYEDKYHQFFPLANPAALDVQNLSTIAEREPHLLAAILTVASKDEKEWWHIHEACSSHMQSLISDLVYSGSGTVEAVEALLILAEWVPRRPQRTSAVGRGEEDQAAWMYVGTAIRLGYLLGIDRTGFSIDSEVQSADTNRKRLAWAACYMSDRQISVRVGKAFWSRGPGPMTALRADNFPSLQPRLGRHDDFAAIFQANLELTQLFSNAHDVLYATKSRSHQLNFGGEYVKYIDDFRVALRTWHSTWGIFSCSAPLKASLTLSYEYLRLYVNAFAYQATLDRLFAQMRASNGHQKNPFGADVAAAPDARFIYDSIDAAKSLLSTFNSFVDPRETFRFMPLRYYLYVIYSACFLYKARATGVMGGDSRGSIKRMIIDTIDRLQKASACSNDVGDRYSRLIRLLWRKPPSHPSGARGSIVEASDMGPSSAAQMPDRASAIHDPGNAGATQVNSDATGQQNQVMYNPPEQAPPPSINTFSWLDLPAVGEFALTNNGSIAGSFGDRFDESSNDGFGGFEPEMLLPQYPANVWNDATTPNIIF